MFFSQKTNENNIIQAWNVKVSKTLKESNKCAFIYYSTSNTITFQKINYVIEMFPTKLSYLETFFK